MTKTLKFVKDSELKITDNVLSIKHKDTVICWFNLDSKKSEIIKGLSPTSNKMIKYFIEFFDPLEIKDLNKDFKLYKKNHFSRPL